MHKKIQKCTITQATPAVRAVIWLRLCRSPSIREVARPPRSSVALMGENNLTKLVKAEESRKFWFIYCNGEQASTEQAEWISSTWAHSAPHAGLSEGENVTGGIL